MACSCQKPRGPRKYQPEAVTASSGQLPFALVLRDGTVEKFGSRLEADAANARAGYTGTIRQLSV